MGQTLKGALRTHPVRRKAYGIQLRATFQSLRACVLRLVMNMVKGNAVVLTRHIHGGGACFGRATQWSLSIRSQQRRALRRNGRRATKLNPLSTLFNFSNVVAVDL